MLLFYYSQVYSTLEGPENTPGHTSLPFQAVIFVYFNTNTNRNISLMYSQMITKSIKSETAFDGSAVVKAAREHLEMPQFKYKTL